LSSAYVLGSVSSSRKKGSNFVKKVFTKGQVLYFAWSEAVVMDYVASSVRGVRYFHFAIKKTPFGGAVTEY